MKHARKCNLLITGYVVINCVLICTITMKLFKTTMYSSAFLGCILYLGSIMIAFSPIGEMVMRVLTIENPLDSKKAMICLDELIHELKKSGKKVPNHIKAYVYESKDKSAYAIGRKTICVTSGMLELSKREIKAILAHELGHLYYHDTTLAVLVLVGNVFSFFVLSLCMIQETGNICFIVLFYVFIWIWTQCGMYIVQKGRGEGELRADQFAAELGYGYELCKILKEISKNIDLELKTTF